MNNLLVKYFDKETGELKTMAVTDGTIIIVKNELIDKRTIESVGIVKEVKGL